MQESATLLGGPLEDLSTVLGHRSLRARSDVEHADVAWVAGSVCILEDVKGHKVAISIVQDHSMNQDNSDTMHMPGEVENLVKGTDDVRVSMAVAEQRIV